MDRERRLKLAIAVLCVIATASLLGNVVLYPQATRPLFKAGDRPLIERTTGLAAAAWRISTQEVRRNTFPIVTDRGFVGCVELRSHDGNGHYGACFDRRSGDMVEESASTT